MAHKPEHKPPFIKRTVGTCRICRLLVDASHALVRDKQGLAHQQCVSDQKRLLEPAQSDGSKCVVNEFSSRVCELGTKSCNVRHSDASNG